MKYVVDVRIPTTKRTLGEVYKIADLIEGELGRADSSGYGMGYRDLQIYYDVKQRAEQGQQHAIELLASKGVRVDNEDSGKYASPNAYVGMYPEPETYEEAVGEECGYSPDDAREMFPKEEGE